MRVTLFREQPALLAPFRRGERRALEQVYWAYVERVEAIARFGFRVVGSGKSVGGARPQEIADLVQETFARAFAERARLAYDASRPYGPYLATIARNLLADAARASGREAPQADLPLDLEAAAAEADEPPWADAATVSAVESYLRELPAELRRVHQLRYEQGRSQEEAARALGLSRQQLRTQEKRLRDGLAAHLARGHQDAPLAVGNLDRRGRP